jgi:hypothetical protein
MIVLGIGLMIIAVLVPKLLILWGIGGFLLLLGLILAVLGMMGRAIGGRRHY